MNEIEIRMPAKLNLTLDILGKRSDGYHNMEMVMQSVGLYDTVCVAEAAPGEIVLSGNGGGIPQDERNTAHRAAAAFFSCTGVHGGAAVRIHKAIPSQAGLGGASADAAGVLLGLNRLFETGLSRAQLCEIGIKVGADVPFCLTGGTTLTEGIGERITPLPALEGCCFVILMPSGGMMTAEAFDRFDRFAQSCESFRRPDTGAMCGAIRAGDTAAVGRETCNVFERVVCPEQTARLKERILDTGALGSAMTGSGTALFGLYGDSGRAERAAETLRGQGETFVADPVAAVEYK